MHRIVTLHNVSITASKSNKGEAKRLLTLKLTAQIYQYLGEQQKGKKGK